ncbi:MAG: hypothetical protein ABIG28_01330 [archaeon]
MTNKRITNERYYGIDDVVQELGKRHFASEADVIRERNTARFDNPVWRAYGWTRGARIYAPEKDVLLLRDSPLLDTKLAKQAVKANRKKRLFPLSLETFNQYHKQAKREEDKLPEKRIILILPEKDTFTINEDENFEVLRYLAKGKKAGKDYLSKLGEREIDQLTFYLYGSSEGDNEEQPFVEQSWLLDLADGSSFDGVRRGLVGHGRAFGVFPVTSEARARQNSTSITFETKSEPLPYTSRQVDLELKRLDRLKKEIERSKTFLEGLRKQ